MTERLRTGRVCALILAGGGSVRMGRDKTSLRFDGRTLLERAVSFWRTYGGVDDILVAVGREGHIDALPEGVLAVCDLYPGCGPMAGLHAAFALTEAELLYVSAVDMPFLAPQAVLPPPRGDAAVYIRGGRPEPLFGVYRRSLLPLLEAALAAGERRMTALLRRADTDYIPLPPAFAGITANVNTLPELWRACAGAPPAVAFVGWSGSGKTTFLEKLIPVLTGRGLRVAVIKSDAHGFQMDTPGKDTYRFAAAGAVCTAISGPNGWAVLGAEQTELSALREKLPPVDIVLVEGHKYSTLPKIEVHRRATGKPLVTHDATLAAVVTDEPVEAGAPLLGLEDTEACAALLQELFLGGA